MNTFYYDLGITHFWKFFEGLCYDKSPSFDVLASHFAYLNPNQIWACLFLWKPKIIQSKWHEVSTFWGHLLILWYVHLLQCIESSLGIQIPVNLKYLIMNLILPLIQNCPLDFHEPQVCKLKCKSTPSIHICGGFISHSNGADIIWHFAQLRSSLRLRHIS